MCYEDPRHKWMQYGPTVALEKDYLDYSLMCLCKSSVF